MLLELCDLVIDLGRVRICDDLDLIRV